MVRINRKNSSKERRHWENIIIGGLIGIFGTIIGFYLNEGYLIPRKADLQIILPEGPKNSLEDDYYIYHISDFLREYNTMEICFFNDGRRTTGRVWANWEDHRWASKEAINIPFLTGGDGSCGELELKPSFLTVQTNNIILGHQDITLRVHCDFCDNRTILKEVSICVYNTSRECGSCAEITH
ncbi:MAG: hypothetical protein ISS48_00500 [Candidatus Aenigmarchaeota archaeon]|nr:hypothetical protein [Candidatus Aenigmarchaeota archaeon]